MSFLNESEEHATYCISSLLKSNKIKDQYEQYWFPTPVNPGDEESHTPIPKRISRKWGNQQEAVTLNPQDHEGSRHKFFNNFNWKDSTLWLEFHDMFSHHTFDIGMNEFMSNKARKTTHLLSNSGQLEDDILVEQA